MESISLLRKRETLCDEWFQRINRELKEGRLPYDEWEMQIRQIEEEKGKTSEALARLDKYLKTVKIIGK